MSASDSIKRASIRVVSWPVFLIALAVLLFYPFVTFFGFPTGLFSQNTLSVIGYAYVLLAPLPALLFFSLQKKREPVPPEGAKPRTALFYGAFFISLLLSGIAYFLTYRVLQQLLAWAGSVDHALPDNLNFFAQATGWFDQIAICVIALLWLVCILTARRRGRFALSVYFLFAAMLSMLWQFVGIFYSMDLEHHGDRIVSELFFPVIIFLLLAAIGMVFWCIFQIFAWRKEKRAAKAAKSVPEPEPAKPPTEEPPLEMTAETAEAPDAPLETAPPSEPEEE